MKFIKYLSLVFVCFIFTASYAPNISLACSSGGCGGCRLDHIRKDASWMAFYRAVVARGAKPISCYRSYQCQKNLARTCGRGRAAAPGRSNHERGIAMDFRTSNGNHRIAKSLAPKIIKGSVRGLTHGGGGFHMSNSRGEGSLISYRATSGDVKAYRENHVASSAPSGSKCGTGSRLTYRKGFKGKWLQRRSCQWVRMTFS